jgi:hypothetical protein
MIIHWAISVMRILKIFGIAKKPVILDPLFSGISLLQGVKDVAGCILFKLGKY